MQQKASLANYTPHGDWGMCAYNVPMTQERKEEYLYSAILADTPLTKRSDMDHTVLPANYTMSAFPS